MNISYFLKASLVVFLSNFILYSLTMADYPSSDAEKHAYQANSKPVYGNASPDEHLGETEVAEYVETRDLKRGLQQRHIQMIALAGTIGTVTYLNRPSSSYPSI